MSNLPISSRYRSTPLVPIEDAEREDLSKRLNEAFTKGEIDQDEYRELLDKLYEARNLGELVPVVERLPARQTYDQPNIVAQTGRLAAGELSTPASGLKFGLLTLGGAAAALVLVAVILMFIL